MGHFIYIFLLTIMVGRVSAQKIHAFIACNTNDGSIGEGAEVNFKNMDTLFQQISKQSKFPLIKYPLVKDGFNLKNLENKLNEARKKITENDIVFVYLNSHGYKNESDKKPFPYIQIGETRVSSLKIHEDFCATKPKLLITLVQSCSDFTEVDTSDQFKLMDLLSDSSNSVERDLNFESVNNYNCRQYLSTRGRFILCAGQPGSSSYTTSNGSYFTNSFIKAFTEEIDTSNHLISWDKLFEKAVAYTYNYTRYLKSAPLPLWAADACNETVEVHEWKGTSVGLNYSTWESDESTIFKPIFKTYFQIENTDIADSVQIRVSQNGKDSIITLRYYDTVTFRQKHHYEEFLAKPEIRKNDYNITLRFTEPDTGKVTLFMRNGAKVVHYVIIEFDEAARKRKIRNYIIFASIAFLTLTGIVAFRKPIWKLLRSKKVNFF